MKTTHGASPTRNRGFTVEHLLLLLLQMSVCATLVPLLEQSGSYLKTDPLRPAGAGQVHFHWWGLLKKKREAGVGAAQDIYYTELMLYSKQFSGSLFTSG